MNMDDQKIVEGSGRPHRRQPLDALQFGSYGQITPRTIKQAGLSGEEEARAREMMAVHGAYLQILDALDYVVDPDGAFHSLAAIPATKLAIAYHLAKAGFRPTGTRYVERYTGPRTPPPTPPEGWHTPPTVTYEHVPREAR
jgi:hypothetical protein